MWYARCKQQGGTKEPLYSTRQVNNHPGNKWQPSNRASFMKRGLLRFFSPSQHSAIAKNEDASPFLFFSPTKKKRKKKHLISILQCPHGERSNGRCVVGERGKWRRGGDRRKRRGQKGSAGSVLGTKAPWGLGGYQSAGGEKKKNKRGVRSRQTFQGVGSAP